MTDKSKFLQGILDKAVDNKKIFGTSFCIKYKGETWSGTSGNLKPESQYFIASTTKLFVTSVILNFRSKGLLNLDDPISRYLDKEVLHGIHTLNGKNYENVISVINLLAHTSGIADYFQQKDSSGKSIEIELTTGKDRSWSFAEAIEYSKTLKPQFAPGTKGKAFYSDTNFQLLGKIIENISGKTLEENLKEIIIDPLGLYKTYMYNDSGDMRPVSFFYKEKELHIPKAMASVRADGGVVSTSEEMMKFTEAFFNGKFFPAEYIEGLRVWNPIFFPMQAGIGIHRFKLPWIFSFGTLPELIGHSGLSGALAYACPEKDLYITGTVNQVAYPDTSFRLAIKLIGEIRKSNKKN